MGLKRRNPARTRLLTAPELLAVMAASPAPAANTETKPAEAVVEAVEAPAPVIAEPRKLSGTERHQMIAKAAYRHAERAGFTTDPFQNWLAAEREIDAELAQMAS